MTFLADKEKDVMDNYPQPSRPIHPLDQPPEPPPSTSERVIIRRVEAPYSPPVISYTILAINVAVFLLDVLLGGLLTNLGSKDNGLIAHGQFWRLVTPMFLHGGYIHLGINSYSLYVIGPQVERSFGHWRFLAVYFLSGLAGSIASFALSPYPSIGASGALFGLIGALIPLLYLNRNVLANTRQRINNIIMVIALNLVFGFTAGGIDNWAHIGGLVGGLSLAWLTSPRYVVRLSTMDSIRIDDESSPHVAWIIYGLAALCLGGLVLLLISLRISPTIP